MPGGDEHQDELAAGWRHEVRCAVRADDSERLVARLEGSCTLEIVLFRVSSCAGTMRPTLLV